MIATVVLGTLVYLGKAEVDRAVGFTVLAWMLALTANQHRLMVEWHGEKARQGMEALKEAGQAVRLGRPGEAAQDLGDALYDAAEEIAGARAGRSA